MVSLTVILGAVFGVLLLAGALAWAISIYNRLVRVDERCENAWSDIDVTLKQRQDVLEKLVDVARRAMDFEQETLQQLVEAREQARRAETPTEHAEADESVKAALGALQINARAEAYPDLRSVQTLQRLQDQIAIIEEQIADRRELYNEAVTVYNTLTRQFPYLLLAGPLGYERRELFEAPESELADVELEELFSDRPAPEDLDEPAPASDQADAGSGSGGGSRD